MDRVQSVNTVNFWYDDCRDFRHDTIVDVISEPFARNRIHSDRHLALFGKSRNVFTNMLARKVFCASRCRVFAVDDNCIGSTFGQLRDEVGPNSGREQQ